MYLLSSGMMGSLTLGVFAVMLIFSMPEPLTPSRGTCVTATVGMGVVDAPGTVKQEFFQLFIKHYFMKRGSGN